MTSTTDHSAAVELLTEEEFLPYGRFADLTAEHPRLCDPPVVFSPDILVAKLGNPEASFSICRVWKKPAVIDYSEYHAQTEEALLPLDGDVLIHVATPSPGKDLDAATVRVFRVPALTLVTLKANVWHGAPIPADTEPTNVLVVLPPETYSRDCVQFSHPPEAQVRVG